MGCSLHVKKCGIELHARPWHWGWRPVLGDHFLNKYVAAPYPLLVFTLRALADSGSGFRCGVRLSLSAFRAQPTSASLLPAMQHGKRYKSLKDILSLIMHPADRDVVELVAPRHACLCRYTAGVYSHIPGGMAALPKFNEGSDFKIPANVVKGDLDT